jgi:hypothetical protein
VNRRNACTNVRRTTSNPRIGDLSRTYTSPPQSGGLPSLRGSQGEGKSPETQFGLTPAPNNPASKLEDHSKARRVAAEDSSRRRRSQTDARGKTRTRGQRVRKTNSNTRQLGNRPETFRRGKLTAHSRRSTCQSGNRPEFSRRATCRLYTGSIQQHYSNGPNPRPELTHHYFLPALIPHKCYNIALEHKNNKSHYRFLYPFSQRRHLSLGHTQVCWIISNRHAEK